MNLGANDKRTLQSLQTGRGIAALAVAAYHLSVIFGALGDRDHTFLLSLFGRGDLGVDFFFVLSGFIILYAHRAGLNQSSRVGDYLTKRWIRVYPLYWLWTIVVVLAAIVVGTGVVPPTQPGDIASTALLVRITEFTTPVRPAWTLFHEILFYGMFSLIIVNMRIGLVILGAWFALIVYNFHYTVHGDWSFRNTALSLANLSFFFGMGAYWLSHRLSRSLGLIATAAGFGVLVTALLIEQSAGKSDGLQFAFMAAFGLIITGAAAAELRGAKLGNAALLLLGNASYAIYLTRENVESLLLRIAAKLKLFDRVGDVPTFALLIGATVITGIAVHLIVEKPLIAMLRKGLVRRAGAVREPLPKPEG